MVSDDDCIYKWHYSRVIDPNTRQTTKPQHPPLQQKKAATGCIERLRTLALPSTQPLALKGPPSLHDPLSCRESVDTQADASLLTSARKKASATSLGDMPCSQRASEPPALAQAVLSAQWAASVVQRVFTARLTSAARQCAAPLYHARAEAVGAADGP